MIPHSSPTISLADRDRILEPLKSRRLASGALVEKFEESFSSYIGLRYGIATQSGSSALHLALLSLNIGKGDEIIIPSYVCTAVLNAVMYTGAMPCLVDIDSGDFNICPGEIKKKLNRRTKAVIVPHMFGTGADMNALLNLGVPLIEDGALSLGATFRGRKLGSFGRFSVFSFYATKMITTGEGGMILTDSKLLADKVKDWRNYDRKRHYRTRYNYKMNEIQASLGLSQLSRLEEFIRKRRRIAGLYDKALFSNREVILPRPLRDRDHVYYRYTIRIKGAGRYIKRIISRGIECKSPVFKPLHRYLHLRDADFPHTSQAAKAAVSIPIYPSLSMEKAKFIAATVSRIVRKGVI